METNPSQFLQDKARNLESRVAPQLEDARRNLADFNTQALRFIQERPGTCLVGALAVGFIVGRIASR
ncbi:MAG TPA: hypothetical protein VEY30_00310 [Myxococcaceae bacterium]|nr:hypothetical protein [Myxococcaceae bacterium]